MSKFAKGFAPLLAGAALLAVTAPAAAQNSSASSSPTTGTPAPPSTGTSTPPATATPPATTAPVTTVPVETAPATPPVIVQQAPPPVQQAPVAISPDAAYPNGFGDPADPFANEARAYNQQQKGFDWGLLGLLGLLGLIPLIRGSGRVRTVYVERDDEPRRVVRRERIDEE
jgi:hypothetical protein